MRLPINFFVSVRQAEETNSAISFFSGSKPCGILSVLMPPNAMVAESAKWSVVSAIPGLVGPNDQDSGWFRKRRTTGLKVFRFFACSVKCRPAG
jgi:hypothetical protein